MKRRTKIKRPAKKAAAKRTHAPKADRLAGSIADRILAELAEIKAQQAEIKALVLAGKSPRRNWSRKFKGPKTPAMADMLNGFDKYMEAKGFPKDDTKEIRRHANAYWLENKCSRQKRRSGSKKGYSSFKAFANACCTRAKANSVAKAESWAS